MSTDQSAGALGLHQHKRDGHCVWGLAHAGCPEHEQVLLQTPCSTVRMPFPLQRPHLQGRVVSHLSMPRNPDTLSM